VTDELSTSPSRDSREERLALTRFSSGGRRGFIVLRGSWGRAVDRFLVRWIGCSMITWQYTHAAGRPYQPSLLLTTIGCRTGLLRSSVLPYYRVGGDLIVCGTRGGGPYDPLWVGNIRADGQCWLHVRRRLIPAGARIASGDERVELFERVAALHGGLRRYQAQAATHGREIPLVILTPRDLR
jgi:deazaflavin-dependent oxidoreductase (nitroreductase family)